MSKRRTIERITQESFREFGSVVEFPADNRENYYIVDCDKENPWRLAVFRYNNHSIRRIECHPTSKESFEPLSGITLLLTAVHENPEDYHIFLLDKPIILNKGVWHQTMVLTGEAQVKITENFEVGSVFYDLAEEISVYVGGNGE